MQRVSGEFTQCLGLRRPSPSSILRIDLGSILHNGGGNVSSGGAPSSSEELALGRLSPFLGPIDRLDVPGTTGACDFVVVEGSHQGAVIEVTDLLHSGRRELREVLRGRPELLIHSELRWTAYLYPRANVKAIERSAELTEALAEAEQLGISQLPDFRFERGNQLLAALGIEMLVGYPATPEGSSTLRLTGGSSSGSGWDGASVDVWLPQALDSDQVPSKREKLLRSGANERHLYLGLDLDKPAGRGVEIMLDVYRRPGADPLILPTVELPEEITDLWLWPLAPSPGLHKSKGAPWEVGA